MKRWMVLGWGLLLVAALLLAACGSAPTPTAGAGQAGLPNPASVFCEDHGGKLDIRTDAQGGQYGVCMFDDGTECDEWAFFRGECQPGEMTHAPEPQTTP
jgi:putative hemolysin